MIQESALAELTALVKRVATLESIGQLLGWDEQVNLPPGAAEQRAAQQALLAETMQAAGAAPRIGELLTQLETRAAELDAGARAIVAQARRDYDRATRLPPEFVREKAAQDSRGFHVWAKARAASDFPAFAPVLETNLELARREAAYLGRGDAPYDCLLDKFDPGLTAAAVDRLFAELRRDLVPLMRAIVASPRAAQARTAAERLRGFPIAAQRQFLGEVTERIGFDYQRGRIDVAVHPFCSGTGSDVRLTTRYREDQPLSALFGSIHEAGHGLYEQGLPAEHLGTALGINAGMAVHESQSRLWENQVGRSRGFWRHFEPRWRELFAAQTAGFSAGELHLAINRVAPTLIRVEADEVTYNLHIVLRFELEKRLFAGDLAVRDLPAAWRTLSRELLGLEPAHDAEGVLQDVHWSGGYFGYFPSYCLGNMIAAQLWARVRTLRPELEDDFARGDFTWLLGWLREHVHARARRQSALELVRDLTGEELSPRHLIAYLQERYGALYLA
jgi:carboxypeptidase Taq